MFRQECESIKPLLSAFLDEDLSDEEHAWLHEHLASCETCCQLLSEYTACRDHVRHLPPAPAPPPEIREKVSLAARKHAERSRLSCWAGSAVAKFSFSSAVVIALVVIVGCFALVQSYERGVEPAVAASSPVARQEWPMSEPIRITFNKPMDHQSVKENLKILPAPVDAQQLPISWEGETLVINTDPEKGAPLLPDTNYTIVVMPNAADAWGNRLGRAWLLSFQTSAPVRLAESTSSTASAAAMSPSGSGESRSATGQNQKTDPATQPTLTPSASPSPSTEPGVAADGNQADTGPTSAASAEASSSPSTSASPSPTQSPDQSPSPSAPSAASSPAPSGDSAPAAAIASATPDTIGVTGAFGSVYWANPSVQERLGQPLGPEYIIRAAELSLQRGTMYERYDLQLIYIFSSDGSWTTTPDTWTEADGPYGGLAPGTANLWIPPRSLGKAWTELELQRANGYAVTHEPRLMEGRVQEFQRGKMLYSDRGFVYVIYDTDGRWELYPDTSGHADLMTPTPAPSSAPSEGGQTPNTTPTPATGSPVPSANPSPDAATG